MPTLKSSVLIIAHPAPQSVGFGADFASDFTTAKDAVAAHGYPVIVLPCFDRTFRAALELLEFLNLASPYSQRVIIQNDVDADHLRSLINTGQIFRILPEFTDRRFDHTVQEALEEYSLLQQNSKLLQLLNEQNDRLKKLTAELEERVEARKKSLEGAREKLLVTNDRVEALHRALVAIHRAGSIPEMERLVNEAIAGALNLKWTRIIFQSLTRSDLADVKNSATDVTLYQAALLRGKDHLGQIYFARSKERPFSRDEGAFLSQIAEAVSLAIDRMFKLEQSETLKTQWEATFDAILEPVSVITDDLTVVRINRSFALAAGTQPEKVIGQKCYAALFARASACEGCKIAQAKAKTRSASLDRNFRLKPGKTVGGQNAIYDVYSQSIAPPFSGDLGELGEFSSGPLLHVNMYHDVTSQLRVERQILESAKMAELGTIGSSIAHELNNPLGGMLSFIQIVKMDLKGNEPWYDDIIEMEKGAKRCRDIVQSLLGFTRKSSSDSIELVDLREVAEQALKITELQTRSIGIKVHLELDPEPIEVRGQFNVLAQAIRNLLQNAQEAIADRPDKLGGLITIRVGQKNHEPFIEINDNGHGIDTDVREMILEPMFTSKNPTRHPGLGLTVSSDIIRDHGGRLEIRSLKGLGTTVIISLPRPVFDS